MDIVTLTAEQALLDLRPDFEHPGPSPLDLEGVVVVAVDGEIDLFTGPTLRSVLLDLMPAPVTSQRSGRGTERAGGEAGGRVPGQVRAVVLDLSEVTFVDSFALGVLVYGHRLARPGGQAYAVVATLGMIHTLFEVTGLSRVLPLYPDVTAAVGCLHPAAHDLHEKVR